MSCLAAVLQSPWLGSDTRRVPQEPRSVRVGRGLSPRPADTSTSEASPAVAGTHGPQAAPGWCSRSIAFRPTNGPGAGPQGLQTNLAPKSYEMTLPLLVEVMGDAGVPTRFSHVGRGPCITRVLVLMGLTSGVKSPNYVSPDTVKRSCARCATRSPVRRLRRSPPHLGSRAGRW